MFFRQQSLGEVTAVGEAVSTILANGKAVGVGGGCLRVADTRGLETPIRTALCNLYAIEGEVDIEVYRFTGSEHCFLPPRPLSAKSSAKPQIALGISSHPASLKVYHRNVEQELVPLKLQEPVAGGALLVEVQSMASDIFYAFDAAEDAHLVIALATINMAASPDGDADDKVFAQVLSLPPAGASVVQVNEEFAENSFAEFAGIHPEFSSLLAKQLAKAERRLAGPYNYRNYRQVTSFEGGDGDALNRLVQVLFHDRFRQRMSELTGLCLGGIASFDLKMVGAGSFQIFNDQYGEAHGLDVVISIGGDPSCRQEGEDDGPVDRVVEPGSWIYVVEGEQVASIRPIHGTMSLAYRLEGCSRFLSYVSQSSRLVLHQFHLLFSVLQDGDDE